LCTLNNPHLGGQGGKKQNETLINLKRAPIKYYSTNLKSPEVTFSEALLRGLAPDGGLYMPSSFPLVSTRELAGFSSKEYHNIAF